MRRGVTRRQFLARAAKAGAAAAAVSALPITIAAPRTAGAATVLTPSERATLDAALARIVPADGAGDWSAADAGAGDYIENLLSGDLEIYAGGPYRAQFASFQALTSRKREAWLAEVDRLRGVYRDGLAELDGRAGGFFVAAPAEAQDLILTSMDLEGTPFFRALYAHTMEGVYAHPVYGGNKDYRAWNDLHYQGDVHGVRVSGNPGDPWHDFGGYAPDDMAEPGESG